jgi:hypothetical protein
VEEQAVLRVILKNYFSLEPDRMNLMHLKEYISSEKANHVRIGELLSQIPGNVEILRVPKVTLGISEYEVEEFDKSQPLSEVSTWSQMDPFSAEIYVRLLSDCIKTLGRYDIGLKGVDLYLQPDGSLMMINFSQISYTKPKNTLLSVSFNIPASVAGC